MSNMPEGFKYRLRTLTQKKHTDLDRKTGKNTCFFGKCILGNFCCLRGCLGKNMYPLHSLYHSDPSHHHLTPPCFLAAIFPPQPTKITTSGFTFAPECTCPESVRAKETFDTNDASSRVHHYAVPVAATYGIDPLLTNSI